MTNSSHGAYTPAEYQTLIRRDADALLAALTTADESAPVPACPGWSVRDLVEHLGQVHQWAGLNASSGLDGGSPRHHTSAPADGEDLAEWYAACVDALLRILATTDPATPCWTFQPGNQTARFWSRRQSHETAMHRNDLTAALGRTYEYETAHAADGIGEVLEVFLYRRRSYDRPALDVPVPVLIECTDGPGRWLLMPVPGRPELHQASGPVLTEAEASSAAAVLRGSAAGLLFTFWHRQDAATAGVTTEGDTALAERLLAGSLTP